MISDVEGEARAEPASGGGRLAGLRAVPLRRLGGFLGLPLISAIAPFLVLPVLLHFVGTRAWAAIAVGQAIGTGTSTLVLLGWTIVGPTMIAEDPSRQRALYTQSLVSRLTVFSVAAPVGVVLAALLSPDGERFAGALMALAMTMLGLSAAWLFVGTGQPSLIARYDTVPRVAATGLAALLVAVVPWAWLYPAFLIVTFTAMAVLVSRKYGERTQLTPVRTTIAVIRQQWAATSVSVQAALNTTLPMALVATVAPGAVAGYAALDRVARFMYLVIQPVGLAFQGWVSEPSSSPTQRRRTASVVTLGVGLALALVFLVAGDLVVRLLFAGQIEVPRVAIVFAAVTIACVALETTLSLHHLVPLHMSRWMALSTAVSIAVAAVGVLLLAPRYGIEGAALAVMLALTAMAATQALALAGRRFRDRAA